MCLCVWSGLDPELLKATLDAVVMLVKRAQDRTDKLAVYAAKCVVSGRGGPRQREGQGQHGSVELIACWSGLYTRTLPVAAVMNRFQDAIKLGVRSVDALQLLLHLIDIVPESRSVRWPVRQ